ncbi:MAG: ParB/RepB/Spo0J family partition protein [Thermoleophilia bacterium]
MSNPKGNKGLGRGLAALIGDTNSGTVGGPPVAGGTPGRSDNSYQILPVSQILGNPKQPRTIFDDEALAELAESLKAVGLVQPVVVRRHGERYELVAGERRWRAAQLAGLEEIPAVIREANDGESLELALIENLSREDLNPIDTARAYAILQEDFGTTQEALAAKLGRSRSAVANTLRLLDLPDEVQELIEKGKLSEGHGRALLAVPDRVKQKKLAARVAKKGLSVRQTEELAKKEGADKRRVREPLTIPVGQELMDETTDVLYSAFRLPVKVRWAANGGKVEMEFENEEQLKRMIDVLENTD